MPAGHAPAHRLRAPFQAPDAGIAALAVGLREAFDRLAQFGAVIEVGDRQPVLVTPLGMPGLRTLVLTRGGQGAPRSAPGESAPQRVGPRPRPCVARVADDRR